MKLTNLILIFVRKNVWLKKKLLKHFPRLACWLRYFYKKCFLNNHYYRFKKNNDIYLNQRAIIIYNQLKIISNKKAKG